MNKIQVSPLVYEMLNELSKKQRKKPNMVNEELIKEVYRKVFKNG